MAADIPNPQKSRAPQLAMQLSLAVGFLMLATKAYAYWMTGSAAILSDAAESVVHVVAVSFAAYSLWFSRRPPDSSHPYGHDKIAFFSAGFEGAMIVLAAFYIVYESIHRLIVGPKLENLGAGTVLVLVAGLINGALGGYLVWVGKKHGSLIIEANGRHVLTDCLTSLGVVVGLGLTILTGWLRFDPIVAILAALDILWMGSKLIRQAIGGLMDEVDPATLNHIWQILVEMTSEAGVGFHGLRHRNAGNTNWVEFHLIFPKGTSLESAHALATKIEERIRQDSTMKTEVSSHLEPLEDHHAVHTRDHIEKFDE
jgi:cation diffusion facilitator family transporter